MEKKENVYLLLTEMDTLPAQFIRSRIKLGEWYRNVVRTGGGYSHVSLSRNKTFGDGQMLSFARKKKNNMFNAGLVKEDIRKGMFDLNKEKTRIAAIELKLTEEQYTIITNRMKKDYERRDQLKFNFPGLISMLIRDKGVSLNENSFFCSQWVTTILTEAGIKVIDKPPHDVRPDEIYEAFESDIFYEGPLMEYPYYSSKEKQKKILPIKNKILGKTFSFGK